jgi:riboflavin synthase
MFTGLVQTKGTLVRRTQDGEDARLVIRGTLPGEALALGESIAVDGVCLTVDKITADGFEVDASSETLAKTTLGALAANGTVNLERALAVGDRLGGHLVSGHVDGVGSVVARERESGGASLKVTFEAPRELARFIAQKGSICVSGVSLTVNGVTGDRFDVMLIPHTQEKTTFDALAVGTRVNLEVDVLARYVARMLDVEREEPAPDSRMLDRLRSSGYL